MAKRIDTLREFERLRRELTTEAEQLRARLADLDKILAGSAAPSSSVRPVAGGAKLGMRDAIQQAIAAEPLGVREITEALHRLGFRFRSKNPYNSVGAYLYGKEGRKHFQKIGRVFKALAPA